ncbi:MAG TPA: hypothetical protein VD968_01625 [Pyrinomonadaceae bacterium]|nr:hypothetical protein [Pyrinomonadaceae bacterium]
MSGEQDKVRELAERVARRLSGGAGRQEGSGDAAEGGGGELADLRRSLSEIQARLTHIESHITHDGRREETPERQAPRQPAAGSTWLSGTYVPAVSHPSQEQFGGIGEAVSELVDFFESEKTCQMEPGGKPCDHCGVCSSRGF